MNQVQISETQADLGNTERSTEQTVSEMCKHIRDCLKDPAIRFTALDAVSSLDGMRPTRQQVVEYIWRWCKTNIEFVPDEVQLFTLLGRRDELELLISPSVMVRMKEKKGDCDCFVMTACALLLSLGVPALIKTFKCDRDEPWRWSHVCAAAVLEDGSICPVDASHGDYAGWQVPARDTFQSQLWDMSGRKVSGGRMQTGLNGYTPEPGYRGSALLNFGSVAGPYPERDVFRAWVPYRSRGLRGIARAKYGMGDAGDVPDPTSGGDTGLLAVDAPDFPSSTTGYTGGMPTVTQQQQAIAAQNAGINWNNLFAQLIGSGSKLGAQALATPGTTILPNGTIVAGTPQGTSAFSFGGIGSSGLLIAGGLLLLVLALGKK